MTLITGWLTKDYKIVASDSKSCGIGFCDKDFQKVFSNHNFAIGLFGSYPTYLLCFRKKALLSKQFIDENWNVERFLSEIKKIRSNSDLNFSPAKILIVPKVDKEFILIIKERKEPEIISLENYMENYLRSINKNLFFSEWLKNNYEVDFEYQNKLTSHFQDLMSTIISNNSDFMTFKNLIIKFYRDVTKPLNNDEPNELYKDEIGGDKVYFAFSISGSDWILEEYSYGTNVNNLDANENIGFLSNLLSPE